MSSVIGIFGGTFNPPHIGHVLAAKSFIKEMELTELFVVPNYIPPLKDTEQVTDAERKLELVRNAFEGLPNTSVSDFEYNNRAVSYTYITVGHFRRLYPNAKIVLLIGGDQLKIFEKWKEFRYLFDNCTLAVADRAHEREELCRLRDCYAEKYGASITLLEFNAIKVSSTRIRRELANGRVPYELLPESIWKSIKEFVTE